MFVRRSSTLPLESPVLRFVKVQIKSFILTFVLNAPSPSLLKVKGLRGTL